MEPGQGDKRILKNEPHDPWTRKEEVFNSNELSLVNICHEIRTPMHIILGLGKQLSKSNFSSEKKNFLQAIITTAENLLFTINETLDRAKIDAGAVEILHTSFQAGKLMNQLKKVLNYKAAEKGLSFRIEFSSAIHPILIGDPFRLNQILINLAWNAFKFTDKGFVKISCRVLSESASDQLLEFEVEDSGIGIRKEQLGKVFDNFYQDDENVLRAKAGTGLGLSISKQLVELLGGTLKVHSEKNIGSRFLFAVPLKKGFEKDLPVSREIILNPSLLKGKHILIADDNELNRLLVTSVLQHYGASFTEALSGEEAIQILQQHPMHLILMDVQMPGISGLESSHFIREKLKSNVPIIALTSNTTKRDLERYSEYGMSDYLTKPFNEEDLIEKISGLLNIPVEWKKSRLTLESTVYGSRYSTHKLKTIGKGDVPFLKKMLTSFIKHASASIADMQSAYDRRDFQSISKIVHRIKPDIDCLGIVELKESIRELEKLAKSGDDQERIKVLLDVVSKTLIEIIQDIQLNDLDEKPAFTMVKKLKSNNNPTRFHSFKLNVPEVEILKRKTRITQG